MLDQIRGIKEDRDRLDSRSDRLALSFIAVDVALWRVAQLQAVVDVVQVLLIQTQTQGGGIVIDVVCIAHPCTQHQISHINCTLYNEQREKYSLSSQHLINYLE